MPVIPALGERGRRLTSSMPAWAAGQSPIKTKATTYFLYVTYICTQNDKNNIDHVL